ncbi:MAG TPA: ATP-binding protein [bacterium]|jgi:signal transduction histidine kinase|nr:ATP-binding protein [bacterium]
MKASGRLRSSLVILAALGVGLLLAALWIDDTQFLGRDRVLGESLAQAQEAGRQSDLVHSVAAFLDPQAVLVDGRRGALLESLSRAADSPAMNAWADYVPGRRPRRTRPVNPQLVLNALCMDRANRWVSAQLTDKTGRVVASWPALAQGAVVDLSHDPYFMALSDPNVGPGIVRHGYIKVATPQGAPAAVLVAACGVADANGAFAGLLKIDIDVHRNLFGRDEGLDPLLAQIPGSEALLVLGDGREIYNSAGQTLTENLATANAGGPGLLAALLNAPTGSQSLDNYDSRPMLAVWQRVGSAAAGATAEDVLSLLVFVPRSAFAVPAPGPGEAPKAFYQQPRVIVPLALALVFLLLALTLLLRATPRDFISSGELLLLPEAVGDHGQSGEGGTEDKEQDAGPHGPPAPEAAEPGETEQEREEAEEAPHPAPAPAPAVDTEALARAAAEHEEALKEVLDQLSAAQAALKEAKQGQDKEAKAGQELKAQLNELRSSLDASKREGAQKLAESGAREARAQEMKAGLEAKLKDSEKAEGLRKDQESVRLAAVNTLSGELKATLEVIKNYISTLLGGQGAISDGQQEFLGVVINKSARLERLINDLVEISEIGSGAKPMRLESLGLSALVQDALVNVRPQAENKNISLELVDNGAAGPVKADRERMGAVLRGLLTQAVKVSPRNEKIGLALAERDATVELRITDSGLNLSPERASKVFVQFHGVDSQAGPEFIGAGLRFNIFKSVVEAQGGTITIESQSSRGKTFVLSLPKDAGGVDAAPAPLAAAPPPLPGGPLPALGALPPPPPPAPPKPASSATLPPPGSLPPLGPPPLPAPKPAAPPAAGLPVLPSLPVLPPVSPAAGAPSSDPAPAPVVHKPAPVDETLNAPWKRKQTDDDLGDLADLISPLPSDLPLSKPAEKETIDFDSLFAPKTEGKPAGEAAAGAKPADTDLLQFSAVFGSKPQGPALELPPPAAAAPSAPAPAVVPPPAAAPAPLASLGTDFDALFGPPGGSAPRPPSVPAAPPAPAPVAPPPPAVPKPVPPPAGFNTLDDLNELLGQ